MYVAGSIMEGAHADSLGGDAELGVRLCLLRCQRPEEVDLVLARRLPLVVRLERALEVSLDVDVESLGL